MTRLLVHLVIFLVLVMPPDSWARRTYITPEQKTQLSRIHTILVSALALSEKGPVAPDSIVKVVQQKFQELGFEVVTDPSASHDVDFHVICEERKRDQPVARYGGDAELSGMPDRLWHGPACQISYRLNGRDLGWYQEVHAAFEDESVTSLTASSSSEPVPVFDRLTRELDKLDFPAMLLSEWGQTHRLISLLRAPDTSADRQRLILDLLREFPDAEAMPHLLTLIETNRYPEEAIGALSGLGKDVIPHLTDLFQDPDKDQSIRAAAAKGLGRIVRANGDPQGMEILLAYLDKAVAGISASEDIEFPVMTEVVWAVGSIHHRPTFQTIVNLQNRIWMIYDTSPDMQKLREVVSVVHRFMEFNQL